jgi:hypothetical protein
LGATKIRLPFLLLVLAATVLTVAAGLMLFSSFMFYDDEGYVLLTLRNFAGHGRLYRDVYSQYGPFPYVLNYGLHLLGLPLTHDAGRLLTLLDWSAAATLTAWTVWRATRSSACMLAVLSSVFVYLWVMISEPSHPGGLIVLTTALMAALGYRWLAAGRWTAWAVLAGAGSAVLLLTKINIGGFATLSAVALLLLNTRHDGLRRWAPWLVAVALGLLPFALMRPLLDAPWVQTYVTVFALAAIPVAGSLGLVTEPRGGGRQWLAAVLGGVSVAAVVLGVIFARGTTPAELLEGVVLGPLRHPTHFSLAFHWPPGALAVAAGSLGLFLLAVAGLRFGGLHRATIDTGVASLRLVAALALALAIWRFPEISPDNLVFAFSVSGLWLFLWPLAGEEPATVIARSWLGLLFLGQWLHPFPVPGSQIAWGTFLALPLAAIGAGQAGAWLAQQHRNVFTAARARVLGAGWAIALVALAVVTGYRLVRIGDRYLGSRSLDLTGAEAVRLPDSTTALYRLLVFNANVHGDLLFSLPGMFSFNLWSGLPTPTLTNVTHWFSLLDDAQQQAIIRSLEAHPRACVIVQKDHLEYLRQHHLTPAGPLYDYVMSQYETAFEIDGFQFRVRRGRHVAPLLTAEIFGQRATSPSKAAGSFTLVKFLLLLPANQPVGSVEIAEMDEPGQPRLILDGSNSKLELTPIDLEGAVRGPTAAGAFPFTLRGPAEVGIYFDRGGRGFSTSRTFLIVRDPAGAELALVRLRP